MDLSLIRMSEQGSATGRSKGLRQEHQISNLVALIQMGSEFPSE
ncbi:hypothetical protein NIES25_43340 [Nostoc linckia NIES-25]|nr:hypothetical protein NIES25_43340 [Nostoc linckia NIES-25]